MRCSYVAVGFCCVAVTCPGRDSRVRRLSTRQMSGSRANCFALLVCATCVAYASVMSSTCVAYA